MLEFFHTMRRQFTPFEWRTIRQNPSDFKQLEMFMRHWVGFHLLPLTTLERFRQKFFNT